MARTFLLLLWLSLWAALPSCKEREQETRSRPSHGAPVASETVLELAELIDPRELDKLTGKRAATPRLRRACYLLEMGRREGSNPRDMIYQAQTNPEGNRAWEQRAALLLNYLTLQEYGRFGEEGMAKLKTSNAPTIVRGEFAGEIATVDHLLPRSVVPELDNKIFNLLFLAESLNQRKGNKIGEYGLEKARRWHSMGLLSSEGLAAAAED